MAGRYLESSFFGKECAFGFVPFSGKECAFKFSYVPFSGKECAFSFVPFSGKECAFEVYIIHKQELRLLCRNVGSQAAATYFRPSIELNQKAIILFLKRLQRSTQ